MHGNHLLLTESGIQGAQLNPSMATQRAQAAGTPEQQKTIQAAKDFESLIIEQLLNQMKDTVGEWGEERDGASKQMHGIFWMHLARDVANQGGIGLWQDLTQSLQSQEMQPDTLQMDATL
ncbi:hypothetical protein ACFL3F_01350 [Planctomycetota bacterium]